MTTPLTCTVEEAAARLGDTFTVDWLKKHIREIPHVKSGKGRGRAGRIGFTDAHLQAIVDKYSVDPAPADAGPRGPITRRRSA